MIIFDVIIDLVACGFLFWIVVDSIKAKKESQEYFERWYHEFDC